MKTILLVGLLASALPAGSEDDQPKGKVVQTTLTAIRNSPDAYKNVWVTFDLHFATLGQVSNPFFTKFVPSDFANFYGWASEQPIWKKAEYENVFGLLFMRKNNKQLEDIYRLKMYQRMRIVGIVRNTFQGDPWIEVTSYQALSKRVTTATLAHMYRGRTFMAKRQWQRAISELSLAPGASLPDQILSAVHRDLAVCYLRLGESGTAQGHLDNAMALAKDPDPELLKLAKVAVKDPGKELDRHVNSAQIADHERPMWEAFEEGQRNARPNR